MTRIVFVSADGTRRSVDARDGDSIMQTAVSQGVEGIVAECGGSMVCATCHVYVDPEFNDLVQPGSEEEDEMLEFTVAPRRKTSRLSCQLKVCPKLERIVIHIPDRQQ